MTNPLAKGMLETATGQNFFTGRPIEESFKYPTPYVLANQFLHNTPAARAITSVRQLGDTRKDAATKALNLGTGLRITDVSGGIEKQQKLAESKILMEMLRESPSFRSSTDVYLGKDRETGKPLDMTPREEQLYRAYMQIKREGQKEAKKRKKAQQQSP